MTVSINKVLITGNLTRDPEPRTTTSGSTVLNFGVAVNDRRRNQQTGEWEDVPNFIDCVVFGSRAEALQRFLSKGTKVAIEGKLRYRSWEAQDGSKRSKIEVVVDDLEFLSSRSSSAPAGQGYESQAAPVAAAPVAAAPAAAAPAAPAAQTMPPSADVYDEDIPF